MPTIEFQEDVAEVITTALEEQKREVGRSVAREVRRNTYRYLEGGDDIWGEPIKQSIGPVHTNNMFSYFVVDHAAAALHEFGGTVESVREVDAGNMAFSWDDDQLEEARKTIPPEYFEKDGPFMVPPKNYLTNAVNATRRNLEE